MFSFPKEITWKVTFRAIPSMLRKRGSEANYSFAVDGVIGVSCVDRLLQPCGREGVFPDESPVETGDACAAVNEGVGVDGF